MMGVSGGSYFSTNGPHFMCSNVNNFRTCPVHNVQSLICRRKLICNSEGLGQRISNIDYVISSATELERFMMGPGTGSVVGR